MLEQQKKKPSEYEFSQKTQNKHSKSQNIIIKVLLPPTVYLTDKCNIPCRTDKQATANKPCHFIGKDGKYLHCSFSNCFEPPELNHAQDYCSAWSLAGFSGYFANPSPAPLLQLNQKPVLAGVQYLHTQTPHWLRPTHLECAHYRKTTIQT